MANRITYTPDADFNKFTDRDPTTELIGYVDQVFAPTKIGCTGNQYDLFKFILSNGSSRKIMCLIWNLDLINKYKKDITVHRILHIDGAYTRMGIMSNEKTALNVLPMDIVIQPNTVVEYLGEHTRNEVIPEETITEVNFETLPAATELISINGYIKTKSGNLFETTYGCGSITDSQFKITVQIGNYQPLQLEKGVYVTVVGTVINNDGLIKIYCNNNACIIPHLEHEKMSAENLLRGLITPRRL